MRVAEIFEGKKQDQARAEAEKKAEHTRAIGVILNNYKNGHMHYALAMKQLCAHDLTVQQAKSRLHTLE